MRWYSPPLSLPSFCVYLCCSPAHPCVRVLISALLSLSLLPAGSHSVAQGWLFFLQLPGIINVCYHTKLVNGLHVNRATRQRVLNFSTSLAVMIWSSIDQSNYISLTSSFLILVIFVPVKDFKICSTLVLYCT